MSNIEKLDPNFKQKELKGGFIYRDARSYESIVFDGLFPGTYCRMDPDRLPGIPSESVQALALHTAGAAVRFRVPGGKFALRFTLHYGGDMSHMPRSGIAGIDVYFGSGVNRRFHACFFPAATGVKEAAGEVQLPPGEEEVMLHLPLYDGLDSLELGFPQGILPEKPAPYRIEKPVLFYGSSITQGGCASRPGNCCSAMVSRLLDCHTWNLGFSGSAKGEPEVAAYIASLSMSAFVMDYDHNADSCEELEKTHLPFLRIILEKQPNLPVLIVSRPDYHNFFTTPEEIIRRRNIIFRSYLWAREQGYRVEFLDGSSIFNGNADCTVDGCHPNDLGFYHMAHRIAPLLQRFMRDSYFI